MANPDVSRLALHSPSHIVGTPFATSSTRYEYPFPDCTTSSLSSPASSPGSSSTSHSSYSQVSFSFNLPLSLPQSAQFHRSITLVASPSAVPTSGAPANHPSPTHPKLRLQGPPPIPPTLIKKRHRWTLGCLARKRDSPLRADDDGSSSDASGWHSDPDASSIRPKTNS
ncbi:hypothetical protein AX14_014189 [Amanita brunnescens Koide BX004]|nr:hypothetical protein AX14_014189 [Amanita brunnescens Koide BX004]